MTINIEDYHRGIKENGLNTDENVDFDGTMNVQGAVTFQSSLTTSGTLTPAAVVEPNEVVTATETLVAGDSGKTIFLNSATEFVTTLPSPAAGLKFRFVVKAAPSGASYTVVTASSANVIQGLVVVNGASVAGADEDTITFADGAAVVGDWAEVVSDGTNWYVSGQGVAAGAITLTQAS